MDANECHCAICGKFQISRTAWAEFKRGDADVAWLKCHIRQQNEFEDITPRLNSNWKDLIEPYRTSPISLRALKLLRFFQKHSPEPGSSVKFDTHKDFPLCDSKSEAQAKFLLEHLVAEGLISKPSSQSYLITYKGWEKLDPISGGSVVQGRVFVAMWFNSEMDKPYDDGFFPAIEHNSKRKSIRLDREHFTEKICDRIFVEIRRCQLGVVDLTEHRPNAYFEAGFAMGLGHPVIFTCRADHMKKLHFDVRQYSCIEWTTPEDLRGKLRARLDALFPEVAT